MDKNGNDTMGCGSGMGLSWVVGWGVRGREKRRCKKHAFWWGVRYRHHFSGIRQVALHSHCIMIFGSVLGITRVEGW